MFAIFFKLKVLFVGGGGRVKVRQGDPGKLRFLVAKFVGVIIKKILPKSSWIEGQSTRYDKELAMHILEHVIE